MKNDVETIKPNYYTVQSMFDVGAFHFMHVQKYIPVNDMGTDNI